MRSIVTALAMSEMLKSPPARRRPDPEPVPSQRAPRTRARRQATAAALLFSALHRA